MKAALKWVLQDINFTVNPGEAVGIGFNRNTQTPGCAPGVERETGGIESPPALGALAADGGMAEDRQSLGLDGPAALLTQPVETHVELLQSLIDFGQVLLGALTHDGQTEMTLAG